METLNLACADAPRIPRRAVEPGRRGPPRGRTLRNRGPPRPPRPPFPGGEVYRGAAPSERGRQGPPRPPNPPNPGEVPHGGRTCSRNPAAPAQVARERSVSPGARPAPRQPCGGAWAAGCAGGAARPPGGGMPGRKLPGKLEQLERASASLLHNSRAAAAGRWGPSPTPARCPPNRIPAGARGGQRLDTKHGPCATPGPGGARRAIPGACAGCAGPGLAEPAVPAARIWMGAPCAGSRLGDRRRVSGDPAAAAWVPAPRAPPGGPEPAPRPSLRTPVPGPAGGDRGRPDPGQAVEVGLRCPGGRGCVRRGHKGVAPTLGAHSSSTAFETCPYSKGSRGWRQGEGVLTEKRPHQDARSPPFPTPHPHPVPSSEGFSAALNRQLVLP